MLGISFWSWIMAAIWGDDRFREGVPFGKNYNFLGEKLLKSTFSRRMRLNSEKLDAFYDFLRKITIWGRKLSMYGWNSLNYLKKCQQASKWSLFTLILAWTTITTFWKSILQKPQHRKSPLLLQLCPEYCGFFRFEILKTDENMY